VENLKTILVKADIKWCL